MTPPTTLRPLGESRREKAALAVFLDRDGVLNRADVRNGVPCPPSSLGHLELLPGTLEACQRLREAGLLLIMVTNQPDIARGTQDPAVVDELNTYVRERLGLHDVRVCPHDDVEDCQCRKPRPGMLTAAAHAWHIDLSSSVMVGDRWRDVEAGRRAGCRTVLVDRDYREAIPPAPDLVVKELIDAVPWIIGLTIGKGHGS